MSELSEGRKRAGARWVWIGRSAVVVLLAVGALLYMMLRPGSDTPASAPSPAQGPATGEADPLRDLKLTRALLEKDFTGTGALWLVEIRNTSMLYTYSDIEFECRYIGADGRILDVDESTINGSIEPGEEIYVSEFRDGVFPAETVKYSFRLTDATATVN